VRRVAAAVLVSILARLAGAGELAAAERSVIQAAATVGASIVAVYTERKKGFDLTGVVVGARDTVLTLRAPLRDGKGGFIAPILVRFPGMEKTVVAEIVDEDEATNTVLLRGRGGRGKPIRLRAAGEAHLGMWVLLVGNTVRSGREQKPVVSLGVVSGIERTPQGVRALFASTLVNPGSFGAPIVDLDGGMLGIVDARVTAAGQQSVVIPFDRIHAAYRAGRGAGARLLGSRPYRHPRGSSIQDLFGIVMEAAARKGARALVGVRSGDLLHPPPKEVAKPGKPAQPEQPGKPAAKPSRTRPAPPPVQGKLEAHDRSSGVVIAPEGLLVCPLRVTGWPGPLRKLTVDLPGGDAVPAKLLGYDTRLRLALLRVKAGRLAVLEEAPPGSLRVGQFLLALGYPHEDPDADTPQLTVGILSRTQALRRLHPAFQAIETDAGVAGGNRGGPLLDVEGRLLGILLDVNDTDPAGYMTRRVGSFAGNCGLGFAVPVEVVRALVPRLEAGAILDSAYLGVGAVPTPVGLEVARIVERNSKQEPTAAKRAGLRVGDIIVSADGHPLRKPEDLTGVLGGHTAGDTVALVILREGKRLDLAVELGAP